MILLTVTDPKRKLKKLMAAVTVLLLLGLLLPTLLHRATHTVADAGQGSDDAITVNGEVWPLESYYIPEVEVMLQQ